MSHVLLLFQILMLSYSFYFSDILGRVDTLTCSFWGGSGHLKVHVVSKKNCDTRTGRNAHSVLQLLQILFLFLLRIDLFFHPSEQQQVLNDEIEILVSISLFECG